MEETYYYQEEQTVEVVEEEAHGTSFLTNIGRWVLVAAIFLFPIFFLPLTTNPIEMNKGYFGSIVALLLLIAWFGGALQEGKVRVTRAWIYPAYLVFLVLWLLSSLFSKSFMLSLVGSGYEATTFRTFLTGGIFLFVIPAFFKDRLWLIRAAAALVVSFLLVALFFIIHSVFNVQLPGFAADRSFSPFGAWSILGGFFAFVVAFLLPFFDLEKSSLRRWTTVLFSIALILLVVTNFSYGIVGLGIVALVFVALLFSRRKTRTTFFGVSLAVILLATLLILMSSLIQKEVTNSIGAPTEVTPSWAVTFSIIKASLGRSTVLGNGPNTFGLLWDRYKPKDLNTTPFWAVRFENGAAVIGTMLAEGGVLPIIAFALFIFFLLVLIFRSLSHDNLEPIDRALTRSFAAGTFLLFYLWLVHPLSISIVLLSFIVGGLFIAILGSFSLVPQQEVDLFSSSERGFVGSLVIIFLLIGGVAGVYYEGTRYFSQVVFAKGVDEFSSGKGINTSLFTIQRATEYDPGQDRFWRTLAQIEISRMQRIASKQEGSPKDLQQQFQRALSAAIDFGKRATTLGPEDSINWNMLGQVYEAAIPVIPESADFAIQNYEKAKDLAPTNPIIYLNLARAHVATANATLLRSGGKDTTGSAAQEGGKASDLLVVATKLKPDFAAAHFLLAQIYQQLGKTDEAIARAEATYQLAPKDVGVLFQLGVLYYQKNNLDEARAVLEALRELNPDYSNGLYFLGLTYDRTNRKGDAIKVFNHVAELNPDSKEIKQILDNLQKGKSALDDGTPSPEKRQDAPLSESKRTAP